MLLADINSDLFTLLTQFVVPLTAFLVGLTIEVTLIYFVYFLILLLHRERRDGYACQAKYGEDWEAYRRRVRWWLVPYIY